MRAEMMDEDLAWGRRNAGRVSRHRQHVRQDVEEDERLVRTKTIVPHARDPARTRQRHVAGVDVEHPGIDIRMSCNVLLERQKVPSPSELIAHPVTQRVRVVADHPEVLERRQDVEWGRGRAGLVVSESMGVDGVDLGNDWRGRISETVSHRHEKTRKGRTPTSHLSNSQGHTISAVRVDVKGKRGRDEQSAVCRARNPTTTKKENQQQSASLKPPTW